MTTFDDREAAEESRYKHDEEFRFKVRNRRNKLLGSWLASEHLGMTGDAAAQYAKDVVMADFDEPGDDDVIRKVRADLDAAGIDLSNEAVVDKLNALESEAEQQVRSE